MELTQVVPAQMTVALAELEQWMQPMGASASLPPFSDEVLAFCDSLSRAMLRDSEARLYPEILAVGFWMRAASLHQLQKAFADLHTPDSILVPQGTAFHIPPANVDTIFLYSWLLSVVAGNRNLIRLSQRTSPQVELLCRLYRETVEKHPAMAGNTRMIRYGHEMEITRALSLACDVRVIWGGDTTVNAVRQAPLSPSARELTFPDRFAMSVLRAEAVLALDAEGLAKLGADFFNDTYWFDQAACSSARVVIWVGSEEDGRVASGRFRAALTAAVHQKKYDLPAGLALEKLTFAYRSAIDLPVSAFHSPDTTVMSLSLDDLSTLPREHCGGGLFFEARVRSLGDLLPVARRKDQTLTHFGFASAELFELARGFNGRGFDRLVPVGEALNFHRYWDGYDLLQHLTRRIHVRGGEDKAPAQR